MLPTCIYIPRIRKHHTEVDVSTAFVRGNYGYIERIDFVTNSNPNSKSAFVHFRMPNYNTLLWHEICNGMSYIIWVSQDEYWICCKAKNPLPAVVSNADILSNVRHLQFLIEEQQKIISKLTKPDTKEAALLFDKPANYYEDKCNALLADYGERLLRELIDT
jgi:hypothetical protein